MKITKESLKQIISEERERLLAESEQGEYERETTKNYGRGGNPTGPSDRRAGGYGDVAKQPEKPVWSRHTVAGAITSLLHYKYNCNFGTANSLAYRLIDKDPNAFKTLDNLASGAGAEKLVQQVNDILSKQNQ
jgi:hypothetical protein